MSSEIRLVMEHRRKNTSQVKELPEGAIEAPGSREMHRIFHSADGNWKYVEHIGYWLRSPQKVDVDALREARRQEIQARRTKQKADRKAAAEKAGKGAKGGNGRRRRKKPLSPEQQAEAARRHTIRLLRTGAILTKSGEASPEEIAERYGHKDTPARALERLRELVDLGQATEIQTEHGPAFRAIRGGEAAKKDNGTFKRTFGGPMKGRRLEDLKRDKE